MDFISSGVRPSIINLLSRDDSPEIICIEDSLMWSVSANSSITALFALPFSGAAVTANFKRPPYSPIIRFLLEPGWVLMERIIPEFVVTMSSTLVNYRKLIQFG